MLSPIFLGLLSASLTVMDMGKKFIAKNTTMLHVSSNGHERLYELCFHYFTSRFAQVGIIMRDFTYLGNILREKTLVYLYDIYSTPKIKDTYFYYYAIINRMLNKLCCYVLLYVCYPFCVFTSIIFTTRKSQVEQVACNLKLDMSWLYVVLSSDTLLCCHP